MLLKKLPGFQRTPYGLECRVLRLIPRVLMAGTFVPAVVSGLVHVLFTDSLPAQARLIQMVDFIMMGLVSFFWFSSATVALGCMIVWLMKGPAYVADGYSLPGHENQQR